MREIGTSLSPAPPMQATAARGGKVAAFFKALKITLNDCGRRALSFFSCGCYRYAAAKRYRGNESLHTVSGIDIERAAPSDLDGAHTARFKKRLMAAANMSASQEFERRLLERVYSRGAAIFEEKWLGAAWKLLQQLPTMAHGGMINVAHAEAHEYFQCNKFLLGNAHQDNLFLLGRVQGQANRDLFAGLLENLGVGEAERQKLSDEGEALVTRAFADTAAEMVVMLRAAKREELEMALNPPEIEGIGQPFQLSGRWAS